MHQLKKKQFVYVSILVLLILSIIFVSYYLFQSNKKQFNISHRYYISDTAQIFHIVDQLSMWSEFCHLNYIEYFENILTEKDYELLSKHAEIHKKLGWDGGLEQAYYTDLPIKKATELAISNGLLTDVVAYQEMEILEQFSKKLIPYVKKYYSLLDRAKKSIDSEINKNKELLSDLMKMIGLKAIPELNVFFIAGFSIDTTGGGFNGGRIIIEVPENGDITITAIHEIVHAILYKRDATLNEYVMKVDNLNYETLNEGIAYALSPGLLYSGENGNDILAETVSRMCINMNNNLENSYYRFQCLALKLRPKLKELLQNNDGTINDLLSAAGNMWKSVTDNGCCNL